jgi:tRNA threonylcarbamoyladenosine biosynthesis protein TsaB
VNLLAIDASTEACSVALLFNGQLFKRFELCPQSHSQLLLPMVDAVLKEASCTLHQLDGLVYGQGPGSFTGVRIGIGVAQGLGFAANLAMVGVSTLQTMAQIAFEKHNQTQVIAAIDARMDEVYNGYYQVDKQGIMQAVISETVLSPRIVKQHIIEQTPLNGLVYGVGTGWQAYQTELNNLIENHSNIDILYPHASAMLTLAKSKFIQGKTVKAENAQPVYVRDTVSWQKLPGR